MKHYADMDRTELAACKAQLEQEHAACKARDLKLNMARGKPGAEQLDLSSPMLGILSSGRDCFAEDGTDCRNYGVLDGLPEAKRLMALNLALPAYEMVLKAGHTFNLLDAHGAISVTERAAYIARIRNISRSVAQSYYDSRERLGFPMLAKSAE